MFEHDKYEDMYKNMVTKKHVISESVKTEGLKEQVNKALVHETRDYMDQFKRFFTESGEYVRAGNVLVENKEEKKEDEKVEDKVEEKTVIDETKKVDDEIDDEVKDEKKVEEKKEVCDDEDDDHTAELKEAIEEVMKSLKVKTESADKVKSVFEKSLVSLLGKVKGKHAKKLEKLDEDACNKLQEAIDTITKRHDEEACAKLQEVVEKLKGKKDEEKEEVDEKKEVKQDDEECDPSKEVCEKKEDEEDDVEVEESADKVDAKDLEKKLDAAIADAMKKMKEAKEDDEDEDKMIKEDDIQEDEEEPKADKHTAIEALVRDNGITIADLQKFIDSEKEEAEEIDSEKKN